MKKSEFQFDGYKVTKSLFELENVSDSNVELIINIKPSGVLDKENASFFLKLSTFISDKSKILNIEVETVGFFTYSIENNDDLEKFLYMNAPAILFPYIRSYISTLSTLSGLSPIVLHTLNLTSLKDELLDNIEITS